jgi:hypothetical protein
MELAEASSLLATGAAAGCRIALPISGADFQRRIVMTSSTGETDMAWGQIAHASAEERLRTMVAKFKELAVLEEDARQEALLPLMRAEYALDDDSLRAITLTRLRTWLALAPDEARTVANSYDVAMRRMPGTAAMRRVGMVQSLATEFTSDEEDSLRELLPGVFAGAPRRHAAAEIVSETGPPLVVKAVSKRPWWAFWQKN